MHERRKFGNEGERLAEKYLTNKGYRILARQWRHPIGELDLVAFMGGEIVFVEVKARRDNSFGLPEEAVGSQKLLKLQKLCEAYCAAKNWSGRYRLDVIAIDFSAGVPDIRHLEAVR